ncbi:MAG: hypothetical protein KJ795_02330 [Gammaproteobacteria bacterium]|nr:hypothetical protein [Gammaproteobacteria bacterium]MBU1775554.1 hypothetical protein [Gammaproteobacteria bacterium]MBU1967604.1 hypothetical protein [Gammaproteobacteria bacterium]
MNRNFSVSKIVSLFFYSLAIGVFVAGCGGGGSNTPISGPSMDYIAEQQNGNFAGDWWLTGRVSSVATANTNTAVANGTNQYAVTTASKILSSGSNGAAHISGTWGPDPSPSIMYSLISSGWIVSPDTATYRVTDGSHITITTTGEQGIVVAVTKTDLASTAISCAPSSCFASGNYPAGSTSYRLDYTISSNRYHLYGDTISLPLTNEVGNQMTALPLLDATTFCLPTYLRVLDPQGSGVYNVIPATSCSWGDISTAIASGTPEGTVTLVNQATGNAIVPNVLLVQSASGSGFASVMSSMFVGVRNNVARLGWMTPAGTYQSGPALNKTALNAELLAHGLVEIP